MSNKYLEKIASGGFRRNMRDFVDTYFRRTGKAIDKGVNKVILKGAIAGGAGGAVLGGVNGYNSSKKGDKNTSPLKGAIGGAILGASLGGSAGQIAALTNVARKTKVHPRYGKKGVFRARTFTEDASFKRFSKDYANGGFTGRYSDGSYGRGGSSSRAWTSRGVKDILSDLDAPAEGFKTKKEATTHFKRMAMKHHPDRPGGSVEKMQKINKAFDEFKNHPDGFEKLAGLGNVYLDYFYGV